MNPDVPQSTKPDLHRPVSRWVWLSTLTALLFVIGCLVPGGPDELGLRLVFAAAIAVVGLLLAGVIRWLCCLRNLKRFLFGAACLLTLIALFYAVENWRGRRAWEAHVRQIESQWGKVKLASLVPPPVPDEQNFAMTPLLKSALVFASGTNRAALINTNAEARLRSLGAEQNPPGRRTNDHLELGSLDRGTFADLEACRAFYRGNTNYPQPVISSTAAEDILVALGKFDVELRELRDAAECRPATRFPIAYDEEVCWAILLPHLAPMKGLTILTRVRATAEVAAGRTADAFADLKLGLRLSDGIRDEPILISHLVRIASLTITLPVLREGLARRAWSDAQLAELEKRLASIDLLAEYKLAMLGERGFSSAGLDYLRRSGWSISTMEMFGGEDPASSAFARAPNFFPSGWFYRNMLTISQMHEDYTLTAVDEKAHRAFTEPGDKLDARIESLGIRPYTIFARMLMPAVSKAVRKAARAQVSVDCARVACALERHRLATGELPENLAALVPRFIDRIPTDVMDGQPLRYARQADSGYLLYSVGWNKTDDHGEIVWTKSKSPSPDIAQGDWVWQMPAKLP